MQLTLFILYTFVNKKKEKRRGFEVSLKHEFDEHLLGHISYTYMQIKQDGGSGFSRQPNEKPNTYRAGLRYKNAGWTYNIDMTAVSGQQVKLGDGQYGYTGYSDRNYFVLDIGAQYQVNARLKLFANASNLTNARYQEVGGIHGIEYMNTSGWGTTPLGMVGEAYFPMPSRSFIIGAEYTF
jgi:outer membrane receptor protein involved in Fe transport